MKKTFIAIACALVLFSAPVRAQEAETKTVLLEMIGGTAASTLYFSYKITKQNIKESLASPTNDSIKQELLVTKGFVEYLAKDYKGKTANLTIDDVEKTTFREIGELFQNCGQAIQAHLDYLEKKTGSSATKYLAPLNSMKRGVLNLLEWTDEDGLL